MEPSSFEPGTEFPHHQYHQIRRNGFMIASLLMGLAAILTFCTLFGGLIFGSLGILFAILSKGNDSKLSGTAIGGMISSISGLVLTLLVYGCAIYIMLVPGELHDEFNEICKQRYGITIEDLLDGKMPEDMTPYSPYSLEDKDYGKIL